MKQHIPTIVLLILTLFLISLAGCGGETHLSHWKKTEIRVDGNPDDWSGFPLEIYEKDDIRMVMGQVNNDTSLNIMFRFHDIRLARFFSRRGITLWLNGDDKKSKKMGIRYVDKNAQAMGMTGFDTFDKPFAESPRDNKKISPTGVFSLIHEDDTTAFTDGGYRGYFASASFEKGVYCYEFEIPLIRDNSSSKALLVSDKNMVKLGIEISPASEAERQKMKEMMEKRGRGKAGGSGTPGGGMRGGGMRGGGMRGGMSDRSNRMMPDLEGKEMWLSIQLAQSTSLDNK